MKKWETMKKMMTCATVQVAVEYDSNDEEFTAETELGLKEALYKVMKEAGYKPGYTWVFISETVEMKDDWLVPMG